ncbi:MAG: DNA polymerase III subunit alpha [Candidatus Nanopelagicales bacterium]
MKLRRQIHAFNFYAWAELVVMGVSPDSFVHLQVASSYSLQYGVSRPDALVDHAADLGQKIIGLTDRNGLYGAVQWARACLRNGISPVLGVDLAVDKTEAKVISGSGVRRTPAYGGQWVDETKPRVILLATGAQGWTSLCRLVSAAHEQRGDPVVSWNALAQYHAGIVALLTAESEVGQALLTGKSHQADALLRPWRAIFDRYLGIAVTSHLEKSKLGLTTAQAARLLSWSREASLPVVLTNAVRYASSDQAKVADLLDSARLLVPLNSRHIVGNSPQGFLKDAEQMHHVAREICQQAGERDAHKLMRDTRHLAQYCALDPAHDLGLGDVFVPELDVLLNRPVAEPEREANQILLRRCEDQLPQRYSHSQDRSVAFHRLEAEMRTITQLGFSGYFLTVAHVVDMVKEKGIRVAARGSGAGSLVNYLLGISGVDPIAQNLLMERFLSPLRRGLPDIDIDVESERRLDIYQWIFDKFGTERIATVSMMETYRARSAIRDVGLAFGLPASDIDVFAKAFPHIRARNVKSALVDLPELRHSSFGKLAATGEIDNFLHLVEALDGLPRHIAMHPCGVVLSDLTLLDRTPVESSASGFPMSHFDKDDVEHMGLLKLDVLGVRMQSAMAHALNEAERVTGNRPVIDGTTLDDKATFELIQSTRTLGCFQIESPGQRELVGKFAPETFNDLVIDISLFRPGPVKSDMITPFLRARQGWNSPVFPHPDLVPALTETYGVVVFHEQVLRVFSVFTGCSLAEADESRRSMGSPQGQDEIRVWFYPAALARGYDIDHIDQVWEILRAFASFGFCKAHAAAFALPTYQSAWLKTHHPAAFYAGLLTHDPGMYPKRLILNDARNFGVTILGLDINASNSVYHLEQLPDLSFGIRVPFTDLKEISEAEIERIISGQPFSSLSDLWLRARPSRPVTENLVVAGAFDALYGFTSRQVRGRITRRDLLLQIADLDRARGKTEKGAAISQLSFDVTDSGTSVIASGLPEMTSAQRVKSELEVLGLDVSGHVMDFYADLVQSLNIIQSRDLLSCRSKENIFVAGVKVATQMPPIRSGKRVVFLTLDDSTGPVDATFFEDAQGPYSQDLFNSWILLVRGEIRRTGPRGLSLRATGCWELGGVRKLWINGGIAAVNNLVLEHDLPNPDAPRKRIAPIHASGFRQSPYVDIKAPGENIRRKPRGAGTSQLGN